MKKVLIATLLLVLVGNLVGQNDLTKKMMMGYQGWFLCQGDNSGPNEWRHWSHRLEMPSSNNLHVDMWPDMAEYTVTYNTNLHVNGQTAKVFSSHDLSTTQLHFQWMRDYNVHGVYLQRFLDEVKDNRFFQVRNKVLENVITAAAETERKFALMYDITRCDDTSLYTKIVADFNHLKNTYNILNCNGYARQENKPVIAIWGFGFDDGHHNFTNSTISQVIDFFKDQGCYIVGGVHGDWRTGNGDASSHNDWGWVYEKLDMITPWSVGSYSNNGQVDAWQSKIIADKAWCDNGRNIEYMPVIWPGFSWSNLYPGNVLNHIPRNGGDFYWRQAYKAIEAQVDFLYGAMFDELDESTAMFKMAASKEQLPDEAENKLIAFNIDNPSVSYPSDWYLQLADEVQKMLDGSISLSPSMTIDPANGPKPPTSSQYLDECDAISTWTSEGTIHLNVADPRQGVGCVQFNGNATMEFSKVFSVPFNSKVSKENGVLKLWYYVDNAALLGIGQLEIGSGGTADVSEYSWEISSLGLKNGWNELNLSIKTANTTGGAPNLAAINWFRIYSTKGGMVKTIVDAIRFDSSGPVITSLDACDEITGWSTSVGSSIHVNINDEKQGGGCIQFNGNGTMEFSKVFTPAYNSGVSEAEGYLRFWYYVDNVNNLGNGQVEIGSGGAADIYEYNWSISSLGLKNGWNEVSLPLRNADATGGIPNLSAINWFRIYSAKSVNVKSIIDDVRFEAEILKSTTTIDSFEGKDTLAEPLVYPNPISSNSLFISIGEVDGYQAQVTIYDSVGRVIQSQLLQENCVNEVVLGAGVISGFYIVKVIVGEEVHTSKVFKR